MKGERIMNYLDGNGIKDYVIDQVIDKLYDYENTENYGCDLAYTLYEGENADGVIFYSTYESKQWIKEHFDDLDEIIEELNFQFGEEYMSKFNPFSEPDKFVLIVVMEIASYLLGQCSTIEKYWNDKFTLTKAKINKIVKELKELKDNK